MTHLGTQVDPEHPNVRITTDANNVCSTCGDPIEDGCEMCMACAHTDDDPRILRRDEWDRLWTALALLVGLDEATPAREIALAVSAQLIASRRRVAKLEIDERRLHWVFAFCTIVTSALRDDKEPVTIHSRAQVDRALREEDVALAAEAR